MKITNEDNMELMARYEDNYFDLAIVDPPYGLDKDLKGGDSGFSGNSLNGLVSKGWDVRPNKEYFKELFRVSKNQIIWGCNYFLEYLYSTKCFISWDKMNGTNDMADFELAWTSFNKGCRRFSMHHFSSGYGKKIHPTQKPVKLYEWLLMNYAQRKCVHKHDENYRHLCTDCRNQDVKILDTHLGSGSIAIACHNLGFDLTACELDKEYYNKAMKRLKEHTAQQRLF